MAFPPGKQAPPFGKKTAKKRGAKKGKFSKDESAPVQKTMRGGRSMRGGGRY